MRSTADERAGEERAGRPDAELDPTLAAERTLLAWNRSALAVAAIGALAIRIGAVHDSDAAYLVGGALLAGAAAVWGYGHAAYPEGRRPIGSAGPLPRVRVMRTVAVATAFTGVAAFALALLG